MPKINTLQTNLNAGELAPRLWGRVDIARYQNAVEVMENCIPLVPGGAKRRGGLRYAASAKYADKRCILLRFVFSATQTYLLEFGDLYMRVIRNRALVESSPGTPYELVTPFTEAMLASLEFTQRADTLFIASGNSPIQRIRRFDHAQWVIDAAPVDPLPFDEIGFRPAVDVTLSSAAIGTGRAFTASAAVFLASDVGREIWGNTGIATITGYTDTTHVTCEITTAFTGTALTSGDWQMRDSPRTTCTPSAFEPVGAAITLTLGAAGWRSIDNGKHVVINGGLCEITGYTSTTVVDAKLLSTLIDNTASPSEAWSLESPVWNASDGYPSTVALFQQALYCGGTTTYPNTIWRSRIGDLLNFTMGVNDDDAFSFTLDSNDQNQILHLFGINQLFAMTNSGAFVMYGGVEKPITPTNIQVNDQSDNGANDVRPIRVAKEVLYAQRTGKKLQAMSYNYTSDDFVDEELSLLSSHITLPGIADMAYQKQPESIVWAVRDDGVIATLTLDRAQQVIGWARQITDGVVEAVATIPVDGADEVWCVVRRTINGTTKRYIEYIDDTLHMDCATVGLDPAGVTTITGLSHLEGKSVRLKADGVNLGDFTVTAGAITPTRSVKVWEIGLPFTHHIKTLPPEIQSAGTMQGQNQSVSKILLRLLDSVAATINGQYVDLRKFGSELLDQPSPTFTGDLSIEEIGWGTEAPVDISSDLPFDFHLLAIITTLTVNAG